eukprot:108147-Rhodomonas_salina.1
MHGIIASINGSIASTNSSNAPINGSAAAGRTSLVRGAGVEGRGRRVRREVPSEPELVYELGQDQ